MDDDPYTIRKFVRLSYRNLNEILADKSLSKFGDALVNFTYSLAKSIVLKMPAGEKVPDSVLAKALRTTPLRQRAPMHAKIDTLGDIVEALIAYMWLTDRMSLHRIVEILVGKLKHGDLSDRKKERRAAREAYISLLETSLKILKKEMII